MFEGFGLCGCRRDGCFHAASGNGENLCSCIRPGRERVPELQIPGGPNRMCVMEAGPNRMCVMEAGPNRMRVMEAGPNKMRVMEASREYSRNLKISGSLYHSPQ